MGSALKFAGESERMGYINARQGDRKVQGVIDYKNQDLYSFGGKSHIRKAYGEASLDLKDAACKGNYYFENKGRPESVMVVEKEYHERVNDYTKNISQGIFFPSLTVE